MSGWIACDVESTGLDPHHHQVWEVALVTDDGQEFSWMVEDVRLRSADPDALAVGRFYERWDCAAASGSKEPALMVARKVAKITAGKHLVGVGVAFDASMLTSMLRGIGNRAPAWHYHLVDVSAMALGYLAGRTSGYAPERRAEHAVDLPWKSYDLSEACGVAPPTDDEKHTALGDARWAARWFRHMRGEVATPRRVAA